VKTGKRHNPREQTGDGNGDVEVCRDYVACTDRTP
jgi:hypothetical protein